MTASLIIDLLIICLLAATTGYCVVLNRRLGQLRAGRGEFMQLLSTFTDATERAEAGIARLRTASDENGAALSDRIEAAQALCDNLSYLIERGAHLANDPKTSVGAKFGAPDGAVRRRPLMAADDPAHGLDSDTPGSDTLDSIARLAEGSDSVVEHDLLEALRAARNSS